MPYQTTTKSAWETAMEAVDRGNNFACVPVHSMGQRSVWTSEVILPQPKDDMDVLAAAIVSIKRARDEAERHGQHPVECRHD